MRLPRKVMVPMVGLYTPLMELKKVVFPAPLGPISPVIFPSWTCMDTSLFAINPPNFKVR